MVLHDVRFGIRMMLKSPGFTAVALLTLALGIGANTTIFSVVNSVLLRPLPYKNPGRIVQVQDMMGSTAITSSFPKFTFLHDHARGFSALTAISNTRVQITGPQPAAPVEISAARVSQDFFKTIGVEPVAGRVFLDSENERGGNAVAVISDKLWRNRFGSDPSVIGKSVAVDGTTTTIVGVMPRGFDFSYESDIWLPKVFLHKIVTPTQIENGASYLLFYGRLADGVTPAAAQAEVNTLSKQYDAAHRGFGDTGRTDTIIPLHESFVGDVGQILMILLGAVGFVLLIASANVANLLLARAVARQKEVAIRASLGAGRGRLVAQFLAESILLATVGAALGLALALWSMRLVNRVDTNTLPRVGDIHIDGAVLAFTVAAAFVTGILFGLGPALHASRVDLNEALKAGSRSVTSGGRLRGAMVAAEVALATILLAGAGLLMRSFLDLENVNPGFRTQNLVTMRLALAPAHYSSKAQQVQFYDRLLERASAIPGAGSAALASALPVHGRNIAYFFNPEGRPPLEPSKAPAVWVHSISPGYLQTMGIGLLAGRAFADADAAGAPLVAIVNRTMARRYWPNEDAVGKHVTYSREGLQVQIVGVASDVKVSDLGDNEAYDQMYVPYRQHPFLTMFLVMRGPSSLAEAARRQIAAIDPDQPISDVESMQARISDSVAQPRLRTALIGSFAALALILATIGIAGVVAWSVSQRTNEIGIRVALGARPSDVLGMLVRQSFTMIGMGQLIGIAGAFALTRVLSSYLFGVSAEDPLTFATVLVAMAFVALVTSALTARRALRIDPVKALQAE